ncbi:MAG: phosphopentomutase, partial [Nitrospirota bacterium]
MARAIIIVLDGVGVGAMPDASRFGDSGSHTLGNLSRAAGGLNLPALGRLGLGNIADIQGVSKTAVPWASWGRMAGVSAGKDTITGHWEMAGITSRRPFPTYPEGFPPEIIEEFERRTGRKALWNRPASGTEIIERLGDEHMRTGNPIVYTSADSVFQIAAHEEVIPPAELYKICQTAREILSGPNNVGRVIARPFIGPVDGVYRVNSETCTGCLTCVDVCPHDVMTMHGNCHCPECLRLWRPEEPAGKR